MRLLLLASFVTVACNGSESRPDASTLDQRCLELEAMFAFFPNGIGYCDGNMHVRCSDGQATSRDCGPAPCISWAVPRTIYAGCAVLPIPHPLCTAEERPPRACDGSKRYLCYGDMRVEIENDEPVRCRVDRHVPR